jgi:peroxiredoxin
MAQLRQDYEKFKAAHAEVLVIVPNGRKMIERHVQEHNPPYRILSDKGAEVAKQYGVQPKSLPFVTAFKPTVLLVGMSGKVLYANYTNSYLAEPSNREPLGVLAQSAI